MVDENIDAIANFTRLPKPPETFDRATATYSDWRSNFYSYTKETAATQGFLTASDSEIRDDQYRLLILEMVRSTMVYNDGSSQLWGYGYRLLVGVSNFSLIKDSPLPTIASLAEIGIIRAQIWLEVRGYKGTDLWANLPLPKNLTPTTYDEFVSAADSVRRTLSANPNECTPVLLAMTRKGKEADTSAEKESNE